MALRSSNFNLGWIAYLDKLRGLVSAKLIEGEILDWCLFRVSEQRLIKWFGKPCPKFAFKLPTSLPASIVFQHHRFKSPLSWVRKLHFLPLSIVNSHKIEMSGGHLQCLRKLPWYIIILWIYIATKVGNVSFVITGS